MDGLENRPRPYVDDGTPAHAAKRIFGLLVAVNGGKVLLNDVTDTANHEIETRGYPADGVRSRVLMESLLSNVYPWPTARMQLRGNLDLSEKSPIITGWLARIGEPSPREIIVKVGNTKIESIASDFRKDLEQHGINKGRHAFSLPVPVPEIDGMSREVVLIDKKTAAVIVKKTCSWMSKKPDYVNAASAAAVQSFGDDRIRLITMPENGGPSAARNVGLGAAQGEILAYLDSDNSWDDRYLAAVAGAFETLLDADAVYSGILLYRNAARLEASDHAGLDHPVAVIIPNWQSLGEIGECLDALNFKRQPTVSGTWAHAAKNSS